MRALAVTHPSGLDHDTGQGHPERPARLGAVVSGIENSGLEVVRLEAPRAGLDDLALIHDEAYIRSIEAFCAAGGGSLDPDTHVSDGSWEAALRSAGAGLGAIEALEQGAADVGFVATRPPGHHALPARAMGFCLFNNIAVAARKLTGTGSRGAIVDWDVHHGNGTQDVFYDDDSVLYVSIHESPWYPGTGAADETGAGAGADTTLNFPVPDGTKGDVYRWLIAHAVVPRIEQFEPDWILVSAGYDAHRSDPLAYIELEDDDYGAMAGALRGLVPAGRTAFFLEGGYNLEAISRSVAATLRGAAGDHGALPEADQTGSGRGWAEALAAAAAHTRSQPG